MPAKVDVSKLTLMDTLDLASLIEVEAFERYTLFARSDAAFPTTPGRCSSRWPRTRRSTVTSSPGAAAHCSAPRLQESSSTTSSGHRSGRRTSFRSQP